MAAASQGEARWKELELRLYQINLNRGLSPSKAEKAAINARRKIVVAMWRADHLRSSHLLGDDLYSKMINEHIRALKPQEDWIRHLVEWEGRSVIPGAKKRAEQLLCGARPNPRKSIIEAQAVELADKIRKTWFVSRPGRPPGARQVPQSGRELPIRDIVEIAAEAIQNHGGPDIDFSSPTTKAALKAAILVLRPNAERSLDREIASYLAASTG